jgi:hypothetical protein
MAAIIRDFILSGRFEADLSTLGSVEANQTTLVELVVYR